MIDDFVKLFFCCKFVGVKVGNVMVGGGVLIVV